MPAFSWIACIPTRRSVTRWLRYCRAIAMNSQSIANATLPSSNCGRSRSFVAQTNWWSPSAVLLDIRVVPPNDQQCAEIEHTHQPVALRPALLPARLDFQAPAGQLESNP